MSLEISISKQQTRLKSHRLSNALGECDPTMEKFLTVIDLYQYSNGKRCRQAFRNLYVLNFVEDQPHVRFSELFGRIFALSCS